MNPRNLIATVIALLAIATYGYFMESPSKDDHSGHDHHDHHHEGHSQDDHSGHGHHHVAPHGGTLVVFGNEFAHLELVLDLSLGKLDAYFLDGMAVMGVRCQMMSLPIEITLPSNETLKLDLKPQTNPLSGEKPGDSTLFSVMHEKLRGQSQFKAKIPAIQIKGVQFKDVSFPFPEGNEH